MIEGIEIVARLAEKLPLAHPHFLPRDDHEIRGIPSLSRNISRVQMDSGLRRRPIEQVVLDLIGDDGGRLG